MKITNKHRERLTYYLKKFYDFYPTEKYTIFHFVRFFKQRLKLDKDAWIAVTGETGSGKTYFVLMAMTLFGKAMSLTKNIAYIPKGDEIRKKFKNMKKSCLLIDEAAREMRSVNWQSKSQQSVNMLAMTERFMNNVVFLNMPSFAEFTKSMRRSNLIFRIIIPYRTKTHARVIVQRKFRDWRSDDPWGDKHASDIYQKFAKRKKDIDNELILNVERSLNTYVMDFIIPNFAIPLPDVAAEYERLKLESRSQVDDEEEASKPVDKYKSEYDVLLTKVTKLLMNNTLGLGQRRVSKADMAEAIGLTPTKFNIFLRKNIETDIVDDMKVRKKIERELDADKIEKATKEKVEFTMAEVTDPLGIYGKKKL